MPALHRVIGLGLDGSTVTVSIARHEIRAIKASYGDKLETAFLSFMGSQEQDEQSPGTYKTDETKISFSSVVFRTVLMPIFPIHGAGNIMVPLKIGRVHPDLGSDFDLLSDSRCTNWAAAVENSNKVEEVETTWTTRQIRWTSKGRTINRVRGTLQISSL